MKWTTIWGNAPSMTEWKTEQYAKNITLTYPVIIPYDGEAMKFRFSNRYGREKVTIDHLAVVRAGEVLFYSEGFSMDAGEEHETEEFQTKFIKDEKVSVQFYLKDFTNMTSGVYTCGKLSGGKSSEGDFVGCELDINKTVSTNWNYFLTDVCLLSADDTHTIICYGDSITAQDWPDELYAMYMAKADNKTAVVRKAVSGTRLLRQYECNQYRSYGIKGDTRFLHEISVYGADTVIIQHGINDIIHPVGTEVNIFRPWSDLPTSSEMVDCIKRYIHIAEEKGLKIYLGTLLPINGWRTYAVFRETLKNEFNEWIRKNGEHKVIDFDRAVRDLDNPSVFAPGFDSGDHLHPSKIAYKAMAQEAINILCLI